MLGFFRRLKGLCICPRRISCSSFQAQEFASECAAAVEVVDQAADCSAYAELIRRCGDSRNLAEGRKLHAQAIRNGLAAERYLLNLLVEMYGKCGSMKDAREVFDKIPNKNEFSWTIWIAANAQNGHYKAAIGLFRQMQVEGVKPDKHLFSMALGACSCVEALAEGRQIHAEAVVAGCELEVGVATALLNMYKKCGSLERARDVFDRIHHEKDVILWTSMLAAYSQSGHGTKALQLFRKMDLEGVKPDRVTFVSLVDACARMASSSHSKFIHERVVASGLASDIVIATALLHMYGKCGSVEDARLVFDVMPHRNVISWNAMISAYAQYGHGKEALELFRRMDQEGMAPDNVTFPSVLDACANLTAFVAARAIHERIGAMGFDSDLVVVSALLNMYGKCGKLKEAREVFDNMQSRNTVSWNAMLTGYAQNGHAKETLELFMEMSLEGLRPDDITFVSVVSACSHGGRVEDGRHYFILFTEDYRIRPTVEHYGCIIDLFGRGGKLDEAEDLIESMPFYPDLMACTTFLRSCRSHKDWQRGARVARRAFEFFPKTSGLYVLLSNIYSEAGELAKNHTEVE